MSPLLALIVDMQDVAVGILEPDCLQFSGDVDVAFALKSRFIIMFESNTCLFKGLHDDSISVPTPQVADVALLVPANCDS